MALAEWALLLAPGRAMPGSPPAPSLAYPCPLSGLCLILPHSGATAASVIRETQEGEGQWVLWVLA